VAYHGAAALAVVGGEQQAAYRKVLHEVLLPRQGPGGEWLGGGADFLHGPSYTTAMAVLALSAEERRLPPLGPKREPGVK
jgi:hypothetical protein